MHTCGRGLYNTTMVNVVLVTSKGQETGVSEKNAAHVGKGMLHRSFSVFLLNSKRQLLIQKRGRNKLLWPGYWSGACCSHPKPNEAIEQAAARRLKEELGFACVLRNEYTFRYTARFKDIGAEKELCTVFLGRADGNITPNLQEIEAIQWISLPKLRRDIQQNPQTYTPWFKMEVKKLWPRHFA